MTAQIPSGFDDPAQALEGFRWHEDMKVVNAFGEHVWLKPLFHSPDDQSKVDPDFPGAKRVGITDCCFVEDPCPRHRRMQEQEDQAGKN